MTRSPAIVLLLFAIRTGLIAALFFGLFIFIAGLVESSSAEAVQLAREKAISSGLFYGAFLALFFTVSNLAQWQQLKGGGTLDPKYRKQLVIPHPYARTEAACRTALKEFAQKGRIRERNDTLLARSKPSWTSWGERLSIELTEIDDSATHVRIACEPFFKATLTDYGRGAELVEAIRKALPA